MKYSFEMTNKAGEKLRVDGCDSFDEAIIRVEKGVRDRDAVLAERAKPAPAPAPAAPAPAAKPDMVEKYDEKGNVIPPAPVKK